MPSYTLIPLTVNSSAAWTDESDSITEDDLWAVNNINSNSRLILSDLDGTLPGADEVIVGIEIVTKYGNVTHLGVPEVAPDEGNEVRIRIGLSIDGTTYIGTYWDVECIAVTENTFGSPTDLHGYTLWSVSDIPNISIHYQRPTDLANEWPLGNRSVDKTEVIIYTEVAEDLEIIFVDGGCDGELGIEWTG